mmetsp:Transcript_24940/g.22081  ORF Transcript_24940/g.22081 Transcript_24940/m.22081 type:complete len:138 (-) Transcript_24940:19-432(-)
MNQAFDKIFGNMELMKKISEKINAQMKDPKKTTFVAVCIAEFLSMYETDRLIIELAQQSIDIHNIVINQVLYPCSDCKMCKSRHKMQKKYLDQIIEMYEEEFHITVIPQQEDEVRGVEDLKKFAKLLMEPKKLPSIE